VKSPSTNPHDQAVTPGHPFGATGASDFSQAVKIIAAMPEASRAIIRVRAEGGEGTDALIGNRRKALRAAQRQAQSA